MNTLLRLRIPTILGLFLLLGGLISGVYLTMQNQTFSSRASSETSPKSIMKTNIEDQSITISWQTDISVPGFVILGSPERNFLDDRDENVPITRKIHHVTVSDLTPETTYQIKIVSGKFVSTEELTTAKSDNSNGTKPIIGSVLEDNNPLAKGVVYLSVDSAVTQSAVIKSLGNFVIPLASIRKVDLSGVMTPALGSRAKIVAVSEDGQKGSASFILRDDGGLIGPLKIGEDLDLTDTLGVSANDKNQDGVINSFDLIKKPANK